MPNTPYTNEADFMSAGKRILARLATHPDGGKEWKQAYADLLAHADRMPNSMKEGGGRRRRRKSRKSRKKRRKSRKKRRKSRKSKKTKRRRRRRRRK